MVKKASEPKDIIKIDNIKLLKVISDPTRKMIIDVLYDKPLTASEIAEKISYPKDKIYYHIKKLKTNGILIIAESEIVKGITQNKFINAAKKFEIDPTLIGEETKPSTDKKNDGETEAQDIESIEEAVENIDQKLMELKFTKSQELEDRKFDTYVKERWEFFKKLAEK